MKHRLTSEQVERLMAGGPVGDHGELDKVAAFVRALPAAVTAAPDPVLSRALVPRLAEAARRSAAETEARAPATTAFGRRRPSSRRTLVARVAVAVALIPACMAGLAFAGVTLPEPARQAFEDLGVTLPNQPSDDSTPSSESEQGKGSSETAPNGKAKGKNGKPGSNGRHKGKALGHGKGQGNGNGGSQGNAGGNSGNAPGHTGTRGASGSAHGKSSSSGGAAHGKPVTPAPHRRARGLSR